jgi:hypothetical protein
MTSCVLAAVLALGLAAQEPFHARRLGGQPSPAATLADMAWLEGHWVGEGLGGVSEELWSPARGGAMMGTYRLLKDGKPVFYEFLMVVEENGTIAMKLKHFNPDFTGWEEKAGVVTFKLVAVEARAVHFDGLSFFRDGDDELRIYLLLRDKDGTVREEQFRMRRARTRAAGPVS